MEALKALFDLSNSEWLIIAPLLPGAEGKKVPWSLSGQGELATCVVATDDGASPRPAGEHQRAGNDEPCAQTTRPTSSITRPCKFQSRSRAQSP